MIARLLLAVLFPARALAHVTRPDRTEAVASMTLYPTSQRDVTATPARPTGTRA